MVSRICCRGKHCCSLGVTAWVSSGLGGLKNTREDTTMYPSSGYRSPTSSNGCCLYSKAPKSGDYNEEERDLAGDRSWYPRLVGGEVGFPSEGEECSGLSLDFRGEERSVIPLLVLCLCAELRICCFVLLPLDLYGCWWSLLTKFNRQIRYKKEEN
jgi:hypothetical protein